MRTIVHKYAAIQCILFLIALMIFESTAFPEETPSGSVAATFMPSEMPQGWTSPSGIQFYGTSDSPGRDGTIYDYIDGGGVVYVDHGFLILAHNEWIFADSGRTLTVDIFDMQTAVKAQSAFTDELVCPEGYEVNGSVTGSKAYNYAPDYLLFFQADHFLVYLAVNDDTERATLEKTALSIQQKIFKEMRHENEH